MGGFLLRPISFRTSLSSRAVVEVSVFLKPRCPLKFGCVCELVSFAASEKESVLDQLGFGLCAGLWRCAFSELLFPRIWVVSEVAGRKP